MDSTVPLRDRAGKVVASSIVDSVDLPDLQRHTWRLQQNLTRGRIVKQYAYAQINGRRIFLHRLLLSSPENREVDHIDSDGLNNRRSNLRLVTTAQQMQNKKSYHGSTSRYRGVHWSKQRGKWRAEIRLNGKNTFLGHFDDEETAALAASAARQSLMTHSVEGS